MIGQIIGAVGSLASSYIDGKVPTQKINAEIKKKQLTGEIDWDIEAIKATQSSWKDEWLTILFSVPLILAFCGEWGRQIVTDGFSALDAMPEYYRYTLGIIVSASFGTRAASKFFGKK